MKSRKIAIIQGHPDANGGHFGHALADHYAQGAATAGHEVRRIEVAALDFPLLRSQARWNEREVPASLREAQDCVAWADHLVIIFPLWLGTMPALLKGFFEQVLRPGFAFLDQGGRFPRKGLSGKSARIVVTMGMPAFWYKWFFRAHGVRGLERSILNFCGIRPVRETLIGLVEAKESRSRVRWLTEVESLGRQAR